VFETTGETGTGSTCSGLIHCSDEFDQAVIMEELHT